MVLVESQCGQPTSSSSRRRDRVGEIIQVLDRRQACQRGRWLAADSSTGASFYILVMRSSSIEGMCRSSSAVRFASISNDLSSVTRVRDQAIAGMQNL